MKKILALIACVLMVFACALPALASEETPGVWHLPLPFQYMQMTNAYDTYGAPFDTAPVNNDDSLGGYYESALGTWWMRMFDNVETDASSTEGTIIWEMPLWEESGWTAVSFTARNVVVPFMRSKYMYLAFPGSFGWTLDGEYYDYALQDGELVLERHTYHKSGYSQEGTLDLYAELASCIPASASASYFTAIASLEFRLTDLNFTERRTMSVITDVYEGIADMSDYTAASHIMMQSNTAAAPDLFSWLIGPIQGFLNISIVPGVTLGGILSVMIIAMVVGGIWYLFKR